VAAERAFARDTCTHDPAPNHEDIEDLGTHSTHVVSACTV
jgi:hypothetical protein